jgi:hypothetical protein
VETPDCVVVADSVFTKSAAAGCAASSRGTASSGVSHRRPGRNTSVAQSGNLLIGDRFWPSEVGDSVTELTTGGIMSAVAVVLLLPRMRDTLRIVPGAFLFANLFFISVCYISSVGPREVDFVSEYTSRWTVVVIALVLNLPCQSRHCVLSLSQNAPGLE